MDKILHVSDNRLLLDEWYREKNQSEHEKNKHYPRDPYTTRLHSNKKAWWKCSTCGHVWEAIISNRSKKDHPRGCPNCKGKKISDKSLSRHAAKTPLTNEKDALAFWDYKRNVISPEEVSYTSPQRRWFVCENGHSRLISVRQVVERGFVCKECYLDGEGRADSLPEELLSMWDDSRNPHDIPLSYTLKIKWACPTCHQTFNERIRHLIRIKKESGHSYCPVCEKYILVPDINDFASTQPSLARELKNPHTASSFTDKDKTKREWVCQNPECGQIYTTTPEQRVRGVGCKKCSALRRGAVKRKKAATSNPLPQWIIDAATPEYTNITQTLTANNSHTLITIKYPECGHMRTTSPNNLTNFPKCPMCSSGQHTSKPEREVFGFVRSVVPNEEQVIADDRKLIHPKEVDIYVPSRRIAIEFNGLYWHDEQHVDKNQHYDKYEACRSHGVQLLQIWEDDWNDRREIVQHMVASKLGLLHQTRVFARKCDVIEQSYSSASEFLDGNHLQGAISGTHYLSLVYHDAIVAMMVLSNDKKGNLLISRYATSCGVPGGFTRLMKEAERRYHPKGFITFSDNMVSDGSLYSSTGFSIMGIVAPDYYYTDSSGSIRRHKFLYRKARFKSNPNLLFEEGLTERELADLNDLHRVYDAGKVKWYRSCNQ